MARGDEYFIEVDLHDGAGFRRVRTKLPVPRAVAEEAKKEILSACERIGADWDVRVAPGDERA